MLKQYVWQEVALVPPFTSTIPSSWSADTACRSSRPPQSCTFSLLRSSEAGRNSSSSRCSRQRCRHSLKCTGVPAKGKFLFVKIFGEQQQVSFLLIWQFPKKNLHYWSRLLDLAETVENSPEFQFFECMFVQCLPVQLQGGRAGALWWWLWSSGLWWSWCRSGWKSPQCRSGRRGGYSITPPKNIPPRKNVPIPPPLSRHLFPARFSYPALSFSLLPFSRPFLFPTCYQKHPTHLFY